MPLTKGAMARPLRTFEGKLRNEQFAGNSSTNKARMESNLSKAAMMNLRWAGLAKFSSAFRRLALGTAFLSAVADRFGLWGVYGHPNVAWGNYARFVDYTAKLNWFLPAAMIPPLAIVATAAETLFGLLLVLGWKTRITALLSGVLLLTFALTMTIDWEFCSNSLYTAATPKCP